MSRTPRSIKPPRRKPAATIAGSRGGYWVGPGQPPREFQFKPGQSGNPKGVKRKSTSILPDLKGLLEDALGGNITLHHGNKERTITKLVAGIEHLVDQFARGDRYARRDLIDLDDRLGVDLFAGQGQAKESPPKTTTAADDETVLADYLKRHAGERNQDLISHAPPLNMAESDPTHEE